MIILVIAADLDFRLALRALLGANSFVVTEAASLAQGLGLLDVERPDLVVLDVPAGDEAAGMLGRLREHVDVPALLLIDKQAAQEVGGVLGGVDDYVVKPFVNEELLARLAVLAHKPDVDSERQDTVSRGIAEVYERDGHDERALVIYLDLGDGEAARRLLPRVIMDVVERGDADVAERNLDAVAFDREPAPVVLARLALASIQQRLGTGLDVIDRVDREGRLEELIAAEPRLGALACNFLASSGSPDRAIRVLDVMPPSRAADAARLLLSAVRDDPESPIPDFAGDTLDGVIARGLYHRGKLRRLRSTEFDSIGRFGGVPDALQAEDEIPPRIAPIGRLLARVQASIDARDLSAAKAARDALERLPAPMYAALAAAEIAIHLERDPAGAVAAITRVRSLPTGTLVFYDEVARAWEGAAHLLLEENEQAASCLREAVASMRRGDRTLVLPTALVYLAEAEWRMGEEEAADRAVDDAYEAAHEQGNMRSLLRSLADFPGVISRRLDAEADPDGIWHTLGRGLAQTAGRAPRTAAVGAHLREFGEPALITETGEMLRPKIRKSLELLSFLLSRPAATASRDEVLNALWGGRDDDSARAYLRQALRQLRSSLAPVVDVSAEEDMLAVAGALTADSLQLEALVSAAVFETGERRLDLLLDAIEMTRRGLFLQGSSDVPWVDDHRARIAYLAADMRLDATALLLETDRHLEALDLVDEALATDSLLERGWRLRMTALGLLGDLDGVALSYRRCRAALAEIGLEPSRATVQLANTMRR